MPKKRSTVDPVSRAIVHQTHLKSIVRDIRLAPRLRLFAEVISIWLDVNDKDKQEQFWTLISSHYLKGGGATLKEDGIEETEVDREGRVTAIDLLDDIRKSNLIKGVQDANA